MTIEQKKLVEDNHNLIFSFIYKENLPKDEYYDLCAIALCEAASKYNGTTNFASFVWRCMRNRVANEYIRLERKKQIPKNKLVYQNADLDNEIDYNDDTNNRFNCYLLKHTSPFNKNLNSYLTKDVAEIVCDKLNCQFLLSKLSKKERQIANYILIGMTQSEIAEYLNCTQQNIAYIISTMRKKLQKIIEN